MSRWRRPDADERAAFEAFVRRHGPALAGLARGLTRSAADAEDLFQETLATVLERWERVAGADDAYHYARRMMVNASTSTWRRRRRELHDRSAEDVLASGPGPRAALWRSDDADGGIARLDDRMVALEALRRLPARQRAVVVLRCVEDQGDEQMAELLGIAPVTVRSTALRGLRALRHLAEERAPAPVRAGGAPRTQPAASPGPTG